MALVGEIIDYLRVLQYREVAARSLHSTVAGYLTQNYNSFDAFNIVFFVALVILDQFRRAATRAAVGDNLMRDEEQFYNFGVSARTVPSSPNSPRIAGR